jgi:tetratricopeptide (TPR) repeat protein
MNTKKQVWTVISLALLWALLTACGGGGETSAPTSAPTAAPAATPTLSADAHVAQGIVYVEQGQLDEAVAEFEAAVALAPNNADAYFQLGSAYYDLGRLDEAAAALQKAVELDPANPDAHRNLGTVYGKLDQWEEAAAAYERAIELKPDFGEAYGDLVGAYASVGRLPEAIAAGEKAIELAPNYTTAYNNLGIAYGTQGDLDAAMALFEQALQIDPEDAMTHYNLGFAYDGLGQLDQAVAEYEEAIRIDANYADARENLGSVLARQNHLDEAIAEWQALVEIAPQRASAHRFLGVVYAMQGQAEDAVAEFETYLELAPDAEDRTTIEQEIAKLAGVPAELEGVYRNAAGGYSFTAPPGWYREESGAMVKFSESPSAMQNAPDAAPLIMFQAGPLNELAANLNLAMDADAAAYLQAMAQSAQLEVDAPQTGTISGYPAALATVSGQSVGIQGAMVVVLVEGRGVSGIALSPPDQWEALSSTFTAMVKGLAFSLPEYRNAAGGYSLRYPGGWSYEESGDTVTFGLTRKALEESEDAAFEEGLVALFDAASLDEVAASLGIQDASDPVEVAEAMATAFDAEVGGVEAGQIGGYPAAYANISGDRAGAPYTGGLVAILVEERLIGAYIMTHTDLWGDVRPVFSDMLDSLSFFEP